VSALDRQRVELVFERAFELSPRERQAMLDASCAGDAELRAEVQLLLDAHDRAEGKFLEGDVARLARQALLPERVGEYRVLRELGRGGMGVVYLAEREGQRPRRRVAVKVLRDGGHALEIRRRFEVERHVLAALDHPHMARLLDGGLDIEGHPFIVMEYVDGLPIDEFCDARRLTIDDRLRLFCTVARAVHHAHRHLIVHRDLKPSNILVTGDGIPKLLDFGIAKLLDPASFEDGPPITADGTRPMTPEYASPEQIRGEPISTASDVYTLGILLCELLTGRRPYPNLPKSVVERELMVLHAEPAKPSSLVAGDTEAATRAASRSISPPRLGRRLRGDLDRIVLTALRKEPERRHQSAEQLAEDVERHLGERRMLAQLQGLWDHVVKRRQRHDLIG
jgi:serine/threonine-protein kinase